MPSPVAFPRFGELPAELRLHVWHYYFSRHRLHMVRPEDTVFDPNYPGLLKLDCKTIELAPSHVNKEARDVSMTDCKNVEIAGDILRRTVTSRYGDDLREEFPGLVDFLEALTPSPLNWVTDVLFLCLPDDDALYKRLTSIPWAREIQHLAVECGPTAISTWLSNYNAVRSISMGRLPQETDTQLKSRVAAAALHTITTGLRGFSSLSELYLVSTPNFATRCEAENFETDENGFVPIDIDAAIDHTGPQFYYKLDENFIHILSLHRSAMRYLGRPFTLKAGINVQFLLPVELSRAHPDRI